MRRAEKEITDRGEIDQILRSNTVCRLGLADGPQPYVIPMSYGYDGECLYFHCAAEGRKLDIIRRNPLVCFEVDCDVAVREETLVCRKSMRYTSVVGNGRAVILDDGDEVLHALDVVMAQHYGPRAREYDPEKIGQLLAIKVVIDSITGKRSGPAVPKAPA